MWTSESSALMLLHHESAPPPRSGRFGVGLARALLLCMRRSAGAGPLRATERVRVRNGAERTKRVLLRQSVIGWQSVGERRQRRERIVVLELFELVIVEQLVVV